MAIGAHHQQVDPVRLHPPGDFAPADALDASCCLCLQPPSEWPEIRQLTCEEAASAGCMSWIRSADVIGEQRYFIPEGRGAELEQAIRERNAAMRVRVTDDGSGFDVDRAVVGQGLTRSVRERIEEVGGTVVVRSTVGSGTEV